MKVTLVSMTPNPIETIAKAASNCYDSKPSNKILSHCYESGHHSIFEFAEFHFHITGISRACSHQLVRHRTANFAQRSQRYVNEGNYDYVTPNSISSNSKVLQLYHQYNDTIKVFYKEMVNNGIPAEDARYILPNACCTVIDMKLDFRNLMHFCNERLCNRAQWEIREVAKRMVDCVREVAPELARYLVPKCEIKGKNLCPETKGCGKHPNTKE